MYALLLQNFRVNISSMFKVIFAFEICVGQVNLSMLHYVLL